MFLKKGTVLHPRSWDSMANDDTIELLDDINGVQQARKQNVYFNDEMMSYERVVVPYSCNITLGFDAEGWRWYPWMFEELPTHILDNE